MTFGNKLVMKCLSLYFLVPSMDLIKNGHFSAVAIKLINDLFCTSVHPSLTMLKPFSFQMSLIDLKTSQYVPSLFATELFLIYCNLEEYSPLNYY